MQQFFLTIMLQAILVKKYASHGQNCGNLKFWSLNPSICLIPIFLSEHPGAMRLNLFMSEPKQMVFQSARNLEDNGLWNLNGSYRPLHHSQNTRKRERGQRGSEATTVLKKKNNQSERKFDKYYAETQASGVKPDYQMRSRSYLIFVTRATRILV